MKIAIVFMFCLISVTYAHSRFGIPRYVRKRSRTSYAKKNNVAKEEKGIIQKGLLFINVQQ